ncbi:MAG: chemoreceptor glutamine deamidase CheD [Methylococcaceae bacterium]|nr:MAG: chemoreceptor glutamine deamidase CheD [Methylococcaceae bacterium]
MLTPSIKKPPPPPLPLPGFEHVKRSWNAKYEAYAARILPGEFYVTRRDEGIYTTLGSCISACIRDPLLGIGGMNHFMLPSIKEMSDSHAWGSAATRYGNFAMEHLINVILSNGGARERLEVKIFGGGCILQNMSDVGQSNIAFVREYLKTEGLQVVSEDVGSPYPRIVVYFPATGRVRVKRLRSLHNNAIVEQETSYINTVKSKPIAGDVELF